MYSLTCVSSVYFTNYRPPARAGQNPNISKILHITSAIAAHLQGLSRKAFVTMLPSIWTMGFDYKHWQMCSIHIAGKVCVSLYQRNIRDSWFLRVDSSAVLQWWDLPRAMFSLEYNQTLKNPSKPIVYTCKSGVYVGCQSKST